MDVITKAEAEKLTLPSFGLDRYFPENGARCSKKHVEYMLQVVWPIRSSYDKVLVAQSAMATFTAIGKFAVGDTDLDHLGAGHIFLMDNPGKGKTLLGNVPAKLVGATFSRFQGVPDALPSDYTGGQIIQLDHDGKRFFELQKGPGFARIQIHDEFNRANPRTQSAVLQVLSEGTITIGNETYYVGPWIIATANPVENEGTFPLSEAYLDRIMFQIRGEDFTPEDFSEIIRRAHSYDSLVLEKVSDIETVDEIREFFFHTVYTSNEIEDKIGLFAAITNNPHKYDILNDLAEEMDDTIILAGLSGRGVLHLIGAARTLAAFRYRNYVTPDDVFKVLLPVLRHRIIFTRGVLRTFRSDWKEKTILDTRDTIIKELILKAWK